MGVGNSVANVTYPDLDTISRLSNIQEDDEELNEKKESLLTDLSSNSVSDDSMDESFHGKHSLRFHEISGKNIRFSNHMRLAERKERTFCDAIVFSQRPVAVNERVTIRLVKQSSDWNGLFKFGFTCLNPIHFKDEKNHPLPKYVYPDMTNQRGCWAASMLENVMHSGDSVYFYYTPNGEIHFGINDKYQGIFLDGVEVDRGQPAALWAVFDVYGNTTAIEFIKTSHHQQHQPNSTSSLMHDSSLADSLSSSSTLSASSSLDTNSLNTTIQSTSSYTNSSLSNTSTSIGSSSVITVIPNRNQPSRAQSALHNNNNKNNKIENNLSNDAKLEQLLVTFRRLCVDNHLNETLHNSILDVDSSLSKNDSLKMRNFYASVPVLFHETTTQQEKNINTPQSHFSFISKCHGKTVKISQPDGLLAYRDENIVNRTHLPTRNAYVFLNKPLELHQSLCIQIVGVDQRPNEMKMSLGIGCTTCEPGSLNATYDLPDDADDLLERPEYWIVYKNIFNNIKQASLADELCFRLDKLNGDLDFYINGVLIKKCLFNVDITQKLWFFFDLCGRTNAIRLIPSCNLLKSNDELRVTPLRPDSALIQLYKSQILAASEFNNESIKSNAISRKNSNSSNKDECRICWEAPIECVFNTCGHMCVCFNCATDLKNQSANNYRAREELNNSTLTSADQLQPTVSKNPLCPICRKEITDIIRFFKA